MGEINRNCSGSCIGPKAVAGAVLGARVGLLSGRKHTEPTISVAAPAARGDRALVGTALTLITLKAIFISEIKDSLVLVVFLVPEH